MNILIKCLCVFISLLLLESCSRLEANSVHNSQEECSYAKIDRLVLPDSSSFFMSRYSNFRTTTKTGVLYYSYSPSIEGSKQVVEVSFAGDNNYLIKDNNGIKTSIRIDEKEKSQIINYLNNSTYGIFYQDCNIIQNHSKVHFIYIRVNNSDRLIYTSFYGSPLKLNYEHRSQLGTAYNAIQVIGKYLD